MLFRSGANTDRKGLMEEAHLGTLFLDEIASLPIDVQAKLLRVLQEGEIKPVGSNKPAKWMCALLPHRVDLCKS